MDMLGLQTTALFKESSGNLENWGKEVGHGLVLGVYSLNMVISSFILIPAK